MGLGNLPLHPIVVHIPLALAMLLPLLASLALWGWRSGRLPKQIWAVIAGLQILIVATGFAAMRTGEADEEPVEKIVAESYIEEHEERAEAFVWTAAAIAALAVAASVVRPERLSRTLMGATCAGTLVVAGLAMWTGHAGGQLVYQHGAASAFAQPSGTAGAAQSGGAVAPAADVDD